MPVVYRRPYTTMPVFSVCEIISSDACSLFLSSRIKVIVALFTLLLLVTDAQESDAMGCFDDHNLSCDVPLDWGDPNLDINHACLEMQKLIFGNNTERLEMSRVANSNDDTSWHFEALSFLQEEDPLCYRFRNTYHKCWWCAKDVPDDFCNFDYCYFPEVVDRSVNLVATCQEMKELHDQSLGKDYPSTIEFCHRADQAAYVCPELYCNQEYLGADTPAKRKALVWLSRTAAFLSLAGASYILRNVVSKKRNRKSIYHQLVFGMAVFDIMTALAWSFATSPVPKEEYWVYGASGNMATCKTQAFFVQLGFTSVFYNVSLSLYYFLVIVHGWRERRLAKIRPLMHGIPVGVGVVLALAGIPSYDFLEYGCHLLASPYGDLWRVLLFTVAPIGLSIVFIMGATLMMYCKVRRQVFKSSKWSMTSRSQKAERERVQCTSTLERSVFYQSIFYVMSFMITWAILFAMYVASVDTGGPFGLTATIAFVAPIQGWNNFLVYVRPAFLRWLQEKKRANTSIAQDSRARSTERSSWLGFSLLNSTKFTASTRRFSKTQEGASPPPRGMPIVEVQSCNDKASSHAHTNSATNINRVREEPEDEELDTCDPSAMIAREDLEEIFIRHQVKEEEKHQVPVKDGEVAIAVNLVEERPG